MKNSNDTIGTRTRDFAACSADSPQWLDELEGVAENFS
jgi:hypothetical protein